MEQSEGLSVYFLLTRSLLKFVNMHHQGKKGVVVSPLSSNTKNNEYHHLKK